MPVTDAAARHDRRAFVDIGSNSVRLVIFAAPPPDHRRFIDEKVNCRLAEGLDRTGRLSPAGVAMAVDAIGGYFNRARSLGVGSVRLVATAAVRDASDGKHFAARLERQFGQPVRILDGDEEAALSARGIMSGPADASSVSGLIVDLGGGSLELVEVKGDGKVGRLASLSLGHIRLSQRTGASAARLTEAIAGSFAEISWLGAAKGRKIYLAGGAFRKLGHLHMEAAGSAGELDGYAIDRTAALRFCDTLTGRPAPGVGDFEPKVIAAHLVTHLLAATGVDGIVFSTRGLMDGCHVEMPPVEQTLA